MGVLNAAPNSFFPDSIVKDAKEALARAGEMVLHGADILDIGGESSQPGAKPISPDEERERVLPIIEALEPLDARISVDTCHAETARLAISLGADMVNDITALRGDSEMAGVIADTDIDCVLMHMKGVPETMQHQPVYDDVIEEILAFFEARVAFAVDAGISEERIWLDPGFGFGKTVEHNLTILARLKVFTKLGFPVMIGTSNKSTIGAVLDLPVEDRMEGTAATVALAIQNGADCVRVHDVLPMARVAKMTDAVTRGSFHG